MDEKTFFEASELQEDDTPENDFYEAKEDEQKPRPDEQEMEVRNIKITQEDWFED
jgi:hypothetical protein